MSAPQAKTEIRQGSPFHDLIAAFFAATTGLGPVFDPANPSKLSPNMASAYFGKIAHFAIDQEQVHKTALGLDVNKTLALLCGMLANTAYESIKGLLVTPETEVLRHLRNAASHGNKFDFSDNEPRRVASWRGFTVNHLLKGKADPLCGVSCFHDTVAPADLIILL